MTNTEHVLYHHPVLGSHLALLLTVCLTMSRVITPLNFGFFMGKIWVSVYNHGEN